jgi:hypothetical protein
MRPICDTRAIEYTVGGDATVEFWKRLAPWVIQLRREQSRQSVYEWFQWLVERLGERERRTTVGAYVRFRDWRA